MYYYDYLESKVGTLLLVEEDGKLVEITTSTYDLSQYTQKETSVLKEVKKQLSEYFDKKRKDFDLPLKLKGTPFQEKVWRALIDIPYGETRTYKDIAEAIDCPKGYRAVGLANNKNKIMIVIPCHRVIGSNGKLVGYAGGLNMKQELLNLERMV